MNTFKQHTTKALTMNIGNDRTIMYVSVTTVAINMITVYYIQDDEYGRLYIQS